MTGGPHALVVDDAADIRMLSELVLSMAGFTVTCAESGRVALDRLAYGPLPDVVLLDVQMPELDGWETLGRLRADPRTAHLRVVLCTVKGLPEDARRGWALGCDAYLGKPFDIGGLVDEINAVLARGEAERLELRRTQLGALSGSSHHGARHSGA